MNQDPNNLLAIPEPNDQKPLANQFEVFLNQFNRITQTVFNQIASSSQSSLSSSSSTTSSNQLNNISMLQEIVQLETYLYNLLEIHSQHDRNSKKIQNLYLTLTELNSNHFKKNLDQIFAIKNKLDIICSDGQNEKTRFEKLNDLALTPGHIMSYARLIAPYTSAPPAPSTDPDQPINPCSGLDLQDPSLRFLMPFPTEDVIRRGRMGQEMSAPVNGANDAVNSVTEIGALLGEIRTADGARPTQTIPNPNLAAYPTMPPRRPPPPPPPEADDDLFDLDLNPDL
ncbi:hypothetical protein PtA15_10A626 [Puccinia triticina]|uniref:Mediator of RNA polymerase II transcription subunit 4 n=1 Tax=Puccinia triticina TaxID=208348 RepID=A0ABY7D2L9_9BASI|nr:uncharacterized protein PtA15_10A626 [Puccinia triticina]WAQ89202.1 hypothetical protein PtA15_10A626 [Puccinia triticina]WAR59253.1 hypothetical protein PtB15_10B595 [Puccinia triticina]